MTTVPSSHSDLLTKSVFWHIATIGPDGSVQSSPVWAGWDGTHMRFSLTRGRQKFHNLAANPSIAMSAIDTDNPYRYLELRGRVVDVENDPSLDFINSMAKKYMDLDKYPYHQPGDERVVMVVEVAHTTQMG